MKKIKFALVIVLAGLFAITFNSCKKTDVGDPRTRIINNGTQKASVQIKTSNGNTVNINNIDPNTTSAYSSYAAGQVTFTATVSSTTFEKVVDIVNGYDYDITIAANNTISTASVKR